MCIIFRAAANACRHAAIWLCDGAWPAGAKNPPPARAGWARAIQPAGSQMSDGAAFARCLVDRAARLAGYKRYGRQIADVT